MDFNKETFDYMAELSKIGLSEEQKGQMILSMQQIVSCIDKLRVIDTSNIKPMECIVNTTNVFREDKVVGSFDRDSILSNAPEKEEGCYSVPKIVD